LPGLHPGSEEAALQPRLLQTLSRDVPRGPKLGGRALSHLPEEPGARRDQGVQ